MHNITFLGKNKYGLGIIFCFIFQKIISNISNCCTWLHISKLAYESWKKSPVTPLYLWRPSCVTPLSENAVRSKNPSYAAGTGWVVAPCCTLNGVYSCVRHQIAYRRCFESVQQKKTNKTTTACQQLCYGTAWSIAHVRRCGAWGYMKYLPRRV